MSKKTSKQYLLAKEIAIMFIDYLQENYPKTFPQKPDPKVPLAIGIHKELIKKRAEISVTKKIICKAIRLWVSGKRYKECLVVGANRYDLAGNPVGKVAEKQIQFMKRKGE